MKLELNLEDSLHSILQQRSKQKGFASVEEYIQSLLAQIGSKITPVAATTQKAATALTDEQRKKISETYKDLGYE